MINKNDLELKFLRKIWSKTPHSAFTDLIQYLSKFYCIFRESDSHEEGIPGKIRIISSSNRKNWKTTALFSLPDTDLRDPHLSRMPDGRFHLIMGGFRGKKIYTFATTSKDLVHWEPLKKIISNRWIWRIQWHQGIAYGIAYSLGKQWRAFLYKSKNGIKFSPITELLIEGNPSEADLIFERDQMVVVIRRKGKLPSKIGKSSFPYQEWTWKDLNVSLSCPKLLKGKQDLWAAGRLMARTPYGLIEKTVLGKITHQKFNCLYILPSCGDSGYPGLLWNKNVLWISYYTSFRDKAEIYLAGLEII